VEYALGTAAGFHQYLAACERFSRNTAHRMRNKFERCVLPCVFRPAQREAYR
jgi:hypothetical protein